MNAPHRSRRAALVGALVALAAMVPFVVRALEPDAEPELRIPQPAGEPTETVDVATRDVPRAPQPSGERASPVQREEVASPAAPEPEPEPELDVVHGRVVDLEGRPLEGALVKLAEMWVGAASAWRDSTRSAADGTFAFESSPPPNSSLSLAAEYDGYVSLSIPPVPSTDDGRTEPLEIVMAPSAQLAITVVDADGSGIPGIDVFAGRVRRDARAGNGLDAVDGRVTDESGRALVHVPAGLRLGVRIADLGWDEHAQTHRAGELSRDPRDPPLVLDAGQTIELLARAGLSMRLTGRVVTPDGEPLPRMRVSVMEGDPDETEWSGEAREVVRTDEAGSFEVELHGMDADDTLTLLAADGHWLTAGEGGVTRAARRRVDVAAWCAAPAPLELVVEPLGSIQGRVVDQLGAPVGAVVWAIPAGAPYELQKNRLGFLSVTLARGSDSSFLLGGLPVGTYDVIVKRNTPRTYHRFPDVETGARDQVFTIVEDRDVRIVLAVEGAVEGSTFQPLLRMHQLREPGGVATLHAGDVHRVRACDERYWYPRHVPALPSARGSSQNEEHAAGRTIVTTLPATGDSAIPLEPQQAGVFSVGMRAWDPDGIPYARRLSRPFRIERGEVRFVVELVPTTSVAGTIDLEALAPHESSWAELRDEDGALLPLPDGATRQRVGIDGGFLFEEVPIGMVEVRVGTHEQLDAERARWTKRGRALRARVLEVRLP